MWMLLLTACSKAYLQQLEAENLQLRLQLATTQAQLDVARAQDCSTGGTAAPPAAPPAPSAATPAAPPAPSAATPAAPPAPSAGTPATPSTVPSTPSTPAASPAASSPSSSPPARGLSISSRPGTTPDTPAVPLTDLQAQAREAASRYNAATALLDENRQTEARTIFQEIIQKFPETSAAYAARKQADELSIVGTPAPALDVSRWLSGSGPQSGKVTILAFWEVWCPHCQHELPELETILQRWKSKGLAINGLTRLSRTATEPQLLNFITENHISFPTALERDGSLSDAYHVTGIPAAAIVKDGTIVWRGHPARLNDALLTSLFAEK